MYQFSSLKKSGLEHAFVVSLAVGALILLAVSGAEGVPYPWLFQLGAFVLAAVFVYLTVRYELKQYEYAVCESGIRDSEGKEKLELVVTEYVGKKATVVARVGLWQIDAVAELGKKATKKIDFCEGKPAFVYDNCLFAARRLGIRMTESDPVVIIPYDEGMFNALNIVKNQAGDAN